MQQFLSSYDCLIERDCKIKMKNQGIVTHATHIAKAILFVPENNSNNIHSSESYVFFNLGCDFVCFFYKKPMV